MPRRILLIDDDPQILQLFRRILTRGGYSVTVETSSKRALEVLKNDKTVELLVLDLSMPEPDGFEILKAMREHRPGLTIIVISGYLDGVLLKAAEILRATASLAKKEAPDRLLEHVLPRGFPRISASWRIDGAAYSCHSAEAIHTAEPACGRAPLVRGPCGFWSS